MVATHIWYASYYNGSIDRTMNGGSSWTNISNAIPDTVKGDWVTPYIIHPLNDNVLFVGYDRLFLSTDYGTSWTSISPIFSNTAKINSIAVPITNPLYIYLVLDDNSIRFSPDYGATWSLLPSYGTAATISNITADPKNENIIWITFSGYNPSAKVFMYNKTTNHWTHVNGSLPNIPIKCLVIDSTTGTKYIGTETTVMYMDTTMTDWAVYNINLPNVIVSDLKINYTTNEVWAGTYGRGIWKSVKADQVSGIATINTNRDNGIIVAPNPNKGIFTLKTTKKELFGAIVNVKILATNGKTVWQKGTKFDENGSLIINAAEIAKGTYICELNANHINFTNSIIIE